MAQGPNYNLVLAGTLTPDAGGFVVPPVVNPSTYYVQDDWDTDASTADYTQVGNVVLAAVNAVSAPLMAASTQGVGYVNTSSTTAGGRVARSAAYGIVQSASINYRWRHLFYMPVASTAANTYTAFIGSFVAIGSANASDVPFAGPYISYTHGTNSGNWVMGSAVNNTRTTANSSTAPSLGAWNRLEIRLANGVYTFLVNDVSIGTVTDANVTASQANGQCASLGGIMIIPDGTNFTTNRVLMIDRSDYYVTGLTR